ncbi:MAG: hypothetical protein WCR72_10710 [Bacteroidota bacterium]
MKRQYLRFQNPFSVKGRRSFKTMATQSTHHYDALTAGQAKPRIDELRLRTQPVYQNYHDQYDIWNNSQGVAKGGTRGFDSLFDEVPSKLKHWQHKIINVYDENSVPFLSIFPRGRYDIYQGTQEQQLSKLRSLEMETAKYPDLKNISGEIAEFNAQLAAAYQAKGVSQDAINESFASLDAAYDAMAEMLFRNMLALIDIFIKNTDVVGDYFDMTLLQTAPDEGVDDSPLLNEPAAS